MTYNYISKAKHFSSPEKCIYHYSHHMTGAFDYETDTYLKSCNSLLCPVHGKNECYHRGKRHLQCIKDSCMYFTFVLQLNSCPFPWMIRSLYDDVKKCCKLFDRKCQIFCYPHYKFNKWHMHFLMQYHPRDFVPADGGGTSSHLDTCLRGRKKTISSLLSLQEAILSLVNTKILSIRWRSDNWSSSRKWVSYCSRMQEGYDPDDIPPVKMGYPLSYGFRREKSHSHPDGTF